MDRIGTTGDLAELAPSTRVCDPDLPELGSGEEGLGESMKRGRVLGGGGMDRDGVNPSSGDEVVIATPMSSSPDGDLDLWNPAKVPLWGSCSGLGCVMAFVGRGSSGTRGTWSTSCRLGRRFRGLGSATVGTARGKRDTPDPAMVVDRRRSRRHRTGPRSRYAV